MIPSDGGKGYGKILILNEKHGTRYIDVEASGGWEAVALALVSERWDRSFRWMGSRNRPERPQQPSKTAQKWMKAAFSKAHLEWKQELADWKREERATKLLLRAQEGKGKAAVEYLNMFHDDPHEGFIVMEPEHLVTK